MVHRGMIKFSNAHLCKLWHITTQLTDFKGVDQGIPSKVKAYQETIICLAKLYKKTKQNSRTPSKTGAPSSSAFFQRFILKYQSHEQARLHFSVSNISDTYWANIHMRAHASVYSAQLPHVHQPRESHSTIVGFTVFKKPHTDVNEAP